MYTQADRWENFIQAENPPTLPTIFVIDLTIPYPIASFSCQLLTHVLCLVGLKITLLLSLRTPRNKFVQENMGI
jgi:hypothetical protein